MIRLSLGTAARLGLLRLRTMAQPTTAYLLHGEGCLRNCAFCPQARGARRPAGRLGRVTWPSFPLDQVICRLQQARSKGLQRICLQAVHERGGSAAGAAMTRQLKSALSLPLTLSVHVRSTVRRRLLLRQGRSGSPSPLTRRRQSL